MLSLKQLREIDPSLSHLSDEELIEIRDKLYELGELIWDDWIESKKKEDDFQ